MVSEAATPWRIGQRLSKNQLEPWRRELSALLALAWPLILMQLAQIGINTVEIIYAGRLGATELAAAGLGSHTFGSFFLLSLGLAIAVAPLVAQARGARDFRMIRRSVRQGLWAVTLISLPGILVMWNCAPLLLAMGQDPKVVAAMKAFLDPLALALPAWLWFFVLRNFAAAMGQPRPALYLMTVAIAVNAVLGYGLTFGRLGLPDWGLTGAGVAAAVATYILAGLMLAFILTQRQLKRFRILGNFWKPDWQLFREDFKIGTPIGLALFFETSLFLAAFYIQGLIGTVSTAAHTIAMQLIAIAFMVPLGLGQATTVRIGIAVGRRDLDAVKRAAALSYLLGIGFTLISAATFLIVPEPLIALFLDPNEPNTEAVIAMAVTFLAVGGLFQLADGGQVVAINCLRGLKDTAVPAWIAIGCYWGIGMPLAIGLGLATALAGVGIWIGLALGLFAAWGLLSLRFWRLVGQGRIYRPA